MPEAQRTSARPTEDRRYETLDLLPTPSGRSFGGPVEDRFRPTHVVALAAASDPDAPVVEHPAQRPVRAQRPQAERGGDLLRGQWAMQRQARHDLRAPLRVLDAWRTGHATASSRFFDIMGIGIRRPARRARWQARPALR